MPNDLLPPQEKIYQTLNKTLTDSFRIIKYLIWPISILFIVVVIFWGVDIYKLRNELDNIKQSLDLKKVEIDLAQRETNIKAIESLNALKIKLEKIDSTFGNLEAEYMEALRESNEQLASLRTNADRLSEFSNVIQSNTNKSIDEYKEIQLRYSEEIKYASIGADQRKKDMEKMFRESTELMLDLTYIIETMSQYSEEGDRGSLVIQGYDAEKVERLRNRLNSQITEFRKTIENNK